LADQIPATYWQRHTLALRPTRCKDRLGIVLLDETGETTLEEFVTREEIKSWINMQQAVGFDGPDQSMEYNEVHPVMPYQCGKRTYGRPLVMRAISSR
jgi:hypothetical protein